MKKITIIIPAYNEEESLPYLYERLEKQINEIKNYEFEILFINDGSKDNTLNIIKEYRNKDKRISYVDFSRNFGKETAIMAGLDYATGDGVIFMDADLQHPPELIPEFIKWWEEGYDDVYAKRRSRTGESFMKKFTSKLYYRVLQSLTNVPIQQDTGDFRLLDRRCVNALKKMRETQRCFKSMFSWIGYNKKEVVYDSVPRIAGKTKWNYKKLIDLAIDGITSFTTSPLRIATYLCIPTFLALFIYFIYVICKMILVTNKIDAYQAIILLILFFSGIQILLFGIIGEYLGRIFNETKNRPLYLVNEYNDKKEKNDAAKGKIFTMIGRELAVAVKEGGPDPANNFKLAQVVAKAKANNMPNDTIERGIKKAAGDGNSVNYETATYEGYGPSGTAIIVKCLTDNKNRTAANVRNAFTKGQGSIGTQGCVSYMFDEKGQIIIDKEECDMDADDLMMQALDAGAEDFADEEDSYEITTAPADFDAVRAALEEAGITMASAEVTMIPQTYVTLTDEADITNIGRILDLLDDDDDVQEVYHNWEE